MYIGTTQTHLKRHVKFMMINIFRFFMVLFQNVLYQGTIREQWLNDHNMNSI